MSTILPNIYIGLGALIVAAGAWLTQKGWNDHADVRQRVATISALVAAIESNRHYLDFAIKSTADSKGEVLLNPSYPPVETAAISEGLTRDLFSGPEYEELRKRLRKAYISLEAYNQAAHRQFASPEQVKSYAQYGHSDSNSLAKLLVEKFDASITVPEAVTDEAPRQDE